MNIDCNIILVACSVLASIAGSFFYIRDTLRGKTKPNRVSWFMWAAAPLVATGAALSADADGWATVRTFMAGFMPLIILAVSFFNKKSYWKLTMFDGMCGASSLIALILWIFINDPYTAIVVTVIGDTLALFPTLRKAWIAPESETGATYAFGFIATLLVVPTISQWDIPNAGFQVYLMIANTALLASIYAKPLLKRSQSQHTLT